MADLLYTDVLNINITDPSRRAEVEAVLTQIGQTAEGQILFGKIQESSGTVDFTNTNISNSYDPSSKTINLNWDDLSTTEVKFENNGFENVSLNRTILHEVFHAADVHFNPNSSEATAIYFTNEFMDKYYSEDRRIGLHDDPNFTNVNQPEQEVSVYGAFNPNPDYKMKGWGGDDMLDLLYDPNKPSWLGGIKELLPQFMQDLLGNWVAAKAVSTPLVLDLDGNGIDLASTLNGVYWDIDEDGFAEKSGWISGNDGLLAIDLNGDGIINDHSELFGNNFHLSYINASGECINAQH